MSHNPLKRAWDEEQVDELRHFWADGWSSSQIAELFGCSRNAVIGKVFRLGLTREVHPSSRPSKAQAAHYARATKLAKRRDEVVRSEPAVAPQHVPGNKTFIELGAKDCRWPLGNERTPAKFFCGSEALHGRPYCCEHCRIGGANYRQRG